MATWYSEADSSSPGGHLAHGALTLCGRKRGAERAEPPIGALTRCTECVIQHMVNTGEIRMVVRTRTGELTPPAS